MGLASDMQRMTEEIMSSFNVRVKGLGTLIRDVHNTLNGFEAKRKRMSSEQKKNLADFKKDLSETVGAILKDANDLLKRLQKDHKKMREEQTKALRDFAAQLSNNVSNMIKMFQEDRKDMAGDLKERLEKSRNDIARQTEKLIDDFEKKRKELEDEVKKMAAHWQAFADSMATKRGVMSKVESKVKTRPVEEAIKEIKPKKKAQNLETQLLRVINEHPSGITLGAAAKSIGVAGVILAKTSKNLLDRGKARKIGNLYFPRSSD